MDKRSIPILVVGLVALVVGALIVWVAVTPEPPEPPPTEPPPVNVRVETVAAVSEIRDTIDLPAVVEVNRVVDVVAEREGTVKTIHCTKGEACEAGALLLELTPLNADVLTAELERAAAAAELARNTYARFKNLQSEKAVTDQDVETALAEMKIAEAERKLAEVHLAPIQIRAPIDGVLDELIDRKGVYVSLGKRVARVVDTKTVKVVARVSERDIPFLEERMKNEGGGTATVFADSNGEERVFEADISYISRLTDESTRATRVEVSIKNEDGAFHDGHIVRIRFVRQVLENVIMVPLDTVIPMEDEKAVYVVKDGVAVRKTVDIDTRMIRAEPLPDGAEQPEGGRRQLVLVKSGLEPGQQLIVKGHEFVSPGRRVNIVKDGAPDTDPDSASP